MQGQSRKVSRVIIVILIVVITLFVLSVAQARTFTNSDSVSVSIGTVPRSVTVSVSDFPAGSTITDVNISITFGHTHTSTCDNRVSTGVYDEVYYYLQAPDGTIVNLVNAGTYDYSGGASVTVQFDDAALSPVGGTPTSGSYQPVGTLADFNGKQPTGIWTLFVGNAVGNGRHCFDTFTLDITTEGQITVHVDDDPDGDGIPTGRDNCPFHFNPDQEDGWGSDAGDACDTEWYNRTGIGIAGFVQKNNIFHLHGNCLFLADGAPRCPVIASFDPSTFDPDVMPLDITSDDAGSWSVWLYYLHSNNGSDVYQVNIYSTNPPQPDTLLDDRLEILVSGKSWRWNHRGGLSQYRGGTHMFASTGDQQASLPDLVPSQSIPAASEAGCQPSRLSWVSCAQGR